MVSAERCTALSEAQLTNNPCADSDIVSSTSGMRDCMVSQR